MAVIKVTSAIHHPQWVRHRWLACRVAIIGDASTHSEFYKKIDRDHHRHAERY